MLDLAPAGVHGHLFARGAEFLMLQLGGLLLVDPSRVVLHFAILADQVNVGALSAWHKVQLGDSDGGF
jgi:hypothetical protein